MLNAGHGYGFGVATVIDPKSRGRLAAGWALLAGRCVGGWWRADPSNNSVLIFLAHNLVGLEQLFERHRRRCLSNRSFKHSRPCYDRARRHNMSHIIFITGMAGGKSTTGRQVARHFPKCLFIQVDELREMMVTGYARPEGGIFCKQRSNNSRWRTTAKLYGPPVCQSRRGRCHR